MADAALPKFKFLSEKPKHTWNSSVQFIDFCVENAHKMLVDLRYSTGYMEFETNPKRNKIYLSTHSDDSGWAGIYLHQVRKSMKILIPHSPSPSPQLPVVELKVVYNMTIFPSTPDQPVGNSKSLAKKLTESGWGFVNMIKIEDAIAAEKKFQAEQSLIHYIPAELRPSYIPFKIHGRLTIRFVDDETWEKHGESMTLHPAMYLYLDSRAGIYPSPPAERLSLESCMAKMLEQVDADQGIVTFKVGPDAVSIQVNSCIVQSRIGVPLLREGLAEAASKEIRLPHVEVRIFRIFIHYIYTHQLSDHDLRAFPTQLLALADQYNVPDLFYKMEHYLCWITQAYPASADVINTLKTAELHNAVALKKACFTTIFTYCRHLLADPAVEALSHKTVVELLRDFAQRHTPELPPPAAPLAVVMQEDVADERRGQRKRKVQGVGAKAGGN